jgi:uracil-DNA glycosylase
MATKYVEDDTDNDFHIESYLYSEEWKTLLHDEFKKDYFKNINSVLKDGYKKNLLRPPKELVFNALNSTSLYETRCVIVGQDPYHDDGQVKAKKNR